MRNKRFKYILYLFLSLQLAAITYGQTSGFSASKSGPGHPFMVVGDELAIWDGRDYNPQFIKGMNLGVSVPGTQPGQLAASSEDYQRWFMLIKEAGYNVIRIYTLHFPRFYEELKAYNETYPQNPLYVLHGIWLEEQESPGDLFNLTDDYDAGIREVVSAVHGDITIDQRFGKAYGVYSIDISSWVMGYLMGREIYPTEVNITNAAHPDVTTFSGSYYSFPGEVDPIEAWLAQRIEYVASFENDNYNTVRPVGISTWPTLDPLFHPTEHDLPGSSEDSEQIDMANIEWSDLSAGFFIGYHAYPYYPDFINKDPNYSVESDPMGPNNYLGYLKDLKKHYSEIPLIIAEFGLPSSWGSGHLSPTGMHHGGVTEKEQGEYTLRMLDNIDESGCAGGIQFALIDEWFKQTWITNPFSDRQYRHYWHNITSPEQNYGILSFPSPPAIYSKLGEYNNMDIKKITAHADFDFFRVRAFLRTENYSSDTIWFAFDTYLKDLGESVLPNGQSLGSLTDTLRAEFVLMIPLQSNQARLYVLPSYDIFGVKDPVRLDTVVSTRSDIGDWNIVRWKTNYFYDITQYIGKMNTSTSEDPFQFLNAVTVFNDSLEVRIPWTLINFYAPNKRRVIHYQSYLENDEIKFNSEDSLSDGIALTVSLNGDLYQTSRYLWDAWELDRVVDDPPLERKKQSYHFLKENMVAYNNAPIGWADTFYMTRASILDLDKASGLLSNDFDMDGNAFYANLSFGNGTRNGQLSLHPDGSFQYIPDLEFTGSDYFMYYLDDDRDYSSLVPVNIFVDPIADERLEVTGIETYQVSPNPGKDRYLVRSTTFMTDVLLNIHDISGRLIQSQFLEGYQSDIFLKNVIPGIYLFKFVNGNHSEVHKVVIN